MAVQSTPPFLELLPYFFLPRIKFEVSMSLQCLLDFFFPVEEEEEEMSVFETVFVLLPCTALLLLVCIDFNVFETLDTLEDVPFDIVDFDVDVDVAFCWFEIFLVLSITAFR